MDVGLSSDFLVNIGLSGDLLVDVGLSSDLNVDIGFSNGVGLGVGNRGIISSSIDSSNRGIGSSKGLSSISSRSIVKSGISKTSIAKTGITVSSGGNISGVSHGDTGKDGNKRSHGECMNC